MDYHHNFDDITAGSLIGILVAYYGYFVYYPPLSDDNCHQPKLHISFKSSGTDSFQFSNVFRMSFELFTISIIRRFFSKFRLIKV